MRLRLEIDLTLHRWVVRSPWLAESTYTLTRRGAERVAQRVVDRFRSETLPGVTRTVEISRVKGLTLPSGPPVRTWRVYDPEFHSASKGRWCPCPGCQDHYDREHGYK